MVPWFYAWPWTSWRKGYLNASWWRQGEIGWSFLVRICWVKSNWKKVDSRRIRKRSLFEAIFAEDFGGLTFFSIFTSIWTHLYQFVHRQVWLPGTYRIQLLQRRKICIFGLIRATRRFDFSMGFRSFRMGDDFWDDLWDIHFPFGDFEGSWIWGMMNGFFLYFPPYIVVL